jgi:hypothetical protein
MFTIREAVMGLVLVVNLDPAFVPLMYKPIKLCVI